MKSMLSLAGLALLTALVASAFRPSTQNPGQESGQNPLPGYDIGSAVQDISLRNVDGKMVSFADFKEAEGLIVIFTCNTCPYALAYEQRIQELDAKYSKMGYPVLAINPNDVNRQPGDSYEAMQKRAKDNGYTFPYLHDETPEVAKQFGATRTPHVYVLNRAASGGFEVAYIGAIDDNYDEPSMVKSRFVEDAIQALQQGKQPDPAKVKAIGCTIKWKAS